MLIFNTAVSALRGRHSSGRAIPILAALLTLAATSAPAAGPDPQALLKSVEQKLATGSEPVGVACFGDSITGVYYHSGSQRAWCDMLGLALERSFPKAKVEMTNAGISGHTTANAMARIEKDVLAHRPQLTVVMFGMNDVTRVPIETYEANLRAIVAKCLAIHSAVVLCTPNNVYENAARSNERLDEYSDVVRRVAQDSKLPLVDFFRLWSELRQSDELAWIQLMSDPIHPNMNGHKLFAEQIVAGVFEKRVSLDNVEPPADGLKHTLAKLRAGQPVQVIATPPWGELVERRMRHHFPNARIAVTSWPVENRSAQDIAKVAATIRQAKPTLVVLALPRPAGVTDVGASHRFWEGLMNKCFSFGSRQWDVVPVLPPTAKAEQNPKLPELMRAVLAGKDIEFVDASKTDSAADAVNAWIDERVQRTP